MTRSRKLLRTMFSLIMTAWGCSIYAQTGTLYQSISTTEGLSQGMVFDILQDQEGFIWVATKNGLNRYDGYNFIAFTNDPYNTHTLSSNTIVKLSEDSKGRIWAGTENAGVNIYDKKTAKFYRIAHRPTDLSSLSGNSIRSSVVEMPDGRILVAAEDAGLNIIELTDDFFTKDAAPRITRLSLPNNAQVFGIGKDKRGNIWVGGMDRMVYRFDPAKNSFTPFNNNSFLYSGHLQTDGSLLINSDFLLSDGADIYPLFDNTHSNAGNVVLRPKKDLWLNFHSAVPDYDISWLKPGKPLQWNEQLPSNLAKTLGYPFLVDHSGILWAGTMGYGLRKYNTAMSKFITQSPGFSVRFIVPVTPNDIFLGAYPYKWIRLRKGAEENNPFDGIIPAKQVDNVILSSTGDYWIRSDDKGMFKYIPSSAKVIAYPAINYNGGWGDKQPMLGDSKGNIWFPGLGGMFTLINEKSNRIDSFSINTNSAKRLPPKSIISALYEDGEGIFWVGTEGGFAKVILRGNVPEVKWFYNNTSDRNSLNYNHVSCFLDDPVAPNKYLWICTKGGGLNRLDKNTDDFLHITTKDGLPDDVVYSVLADDTGNLWGSTNKGIFCLTHSNSKDEEGKGWEFRNFTKSDGLQDDEFNTGAYAKLTNGNLAFGGINGLTIFNPKEVLLGGFTPNVFITSIMVNNQPVVPGDKTGVLESSIEQTKKITLSRTQDILTLEFSSLDFTSPQQNKYRYQLVGIDGGWIQSGTRRSATYLHLPPGKYTFKIQGSNSQGIWSDKIAELQIVVLPPWWRTWWAYTSYALLLILAIAVYIRFSINRAKLKAQLFFEQSEGKRVKELDNLKTQLYTNITHEFRTPLTVILGMAQQVSDNPTEHLKSGTEMIRRNGESLLKLVNEMLDLSKLESGKMTLQLVRGDVIAFLRYIVESFHSLAESQQKQLHFLSEIDSLFISYDQEKMRQIVTNLLSNALKFTPEKGNIYISLKEGRFPGKENQSSFVLKVKDTGIGIPESQLQKIFDRFYQLDKSDTRKTEGTGIGLALTKELVKLMDGEIMVKSPPSGAIKGAEFTVILPITKIHVADDVVAAERKTLAPRNRYEIKAGTTDATKKTGNGEIVNDERPLILLVEDNADVVAYTASCLPAYRLAVGKDGREGFEIATEIIPDLIITDVMMPFVDGFEMCRKLRKDEHTSHIPIIMLTAKADFDSKMEGLTHGADAYLEKPFNKEELLVRIKKLLELRLNLQNFYLRKAGLTEKSLSAPEIVVEEEPKPIADTKTEDAFVSKIRVVVEKNLTNTDFTVEQLCKDVFMSHSQLHRKLDALTGWSPNKFIRMIRLNKSKELLTNQTDSIASIAMDCGYSDPGYFSRVFKQEFGVTPQEWRADTKVTG